MMKRLRGERLLFILKVGLLIVMVALLPVAAQTNRADRWTRLGTSTSGSLLYFDAASLQKTKGNDRSVWSKIVFADQSYQLILLELHCDSKQFSVKDLTAYAEGGEFVTKKPPVNRVTVVPDSVIEGFYNRLCHSPAALDVASANRSAVPDGSRKVTSTVDDPEMLSAGQSWAVITAATANVRAAPRATAAIVRQATAGERLALASNRPTGGWYLVRLAERGAVGWLHGNTFTIVKAVKSDDLKNKKSIKNRTTGKQLPPRTGRQRKN